MSTNIEQTNICICISIQLYLIFKYLTLLFNVTTFVLFETFNVNST